MHRGASAAQVYRLDIAVLNASAVLVISLDSH